LLAPETIHQPGQPDDQPDGDQRHHQVFHRVSRPPFSTRRSILRRASSTPRRARSPPSRAGGPIGRTAQRRTAGRCTQGRPDTRVGSGLPRRGRSGRRLGPPASRYHPSQAGYEGDRFHQVARLDLFAERLRMPCAPGLRSTLRRYSAKLATSPRGGKVDSFAGAKRCLDQASGRHLVVGGRVGDDAFCGTERRE
jgi:hypothetical protein